MNHPLATKPVVELTNLELMFRKAQESGLEKVALRTEEFTFKLAPATGRNKNAVYVTERVGGAYLGMVRNGNYLLPTRVINAVRVVMEQPRLHAIRYGRQTGHCSICGRPLVDPVSVHNAIGPICADKLGIMLEAPDALTKQNLLDLL